MARDGLPEPLRAQIPYFYGAVHRGDGQKVVMAVEGHQRLVCASQGRFRPSRGGVEERK